MFDMFTVFIGGGRKGTMQHYISNTNTGMVWFFIIYVVLVGILFLNLFVGIIITLFQTSLESSATRCGELDLQFHHHVAGLGEERKLKFYKQLGFLAALLYALAMKSVNGLLVLTHPFKKGIEMCGGDLEFWATLRLQAAFRARRRVAQGAQPLNTALNV